MERRSFITTALSVSVAGCIGGGSKSNRNNNTSNSEGKTEDTRSNSAFHSVEFEGTTLVIELQDGVEVDLVRIVNDNGEKIREFNFGTGVARATTEVRKSLDVEWEFLAVKDEEILDSVTKNFTYNLKITDITRKADTKGVTMNLSTKNWDDTSGYPLEGVDAYAKNTHSGSDSWELFTTASIEFTNTGNAPVILTGSPEFLSGTPQYVKEPEMGGSEFLIGAHESKYVSANLGTEFLYYTYAPVDHYSFDNNPSYAKARKQGKPFDAKTICNGETRESKIVYWDSTGKEYKATVSITYSGKVVRLDLGGHNRYYTCENIEINDK